MVHYNNEHKREDWNWPPEAAPASEDAGGSARRRALAEAQPGDEQAEVEPFFPSYEDAVEANAASLAGHGQAGQQLIRDPGAIQGALARGEQHLAYGHYENPDEAEDPNLQLIHAIAKVGHGVAQAQGFGDGNKRTGYWLMHHALTENGLGDLMPGDPDSEVADHLLGYGEGTHTLPDTVAMFKQRYLKRRTAARAWKL